MRFVFHNLMVIQNALCHINPVPSIEHLSISPF
jgi:hypothetical protein